MILNAPGLPASLYEFGIQIPTSGARTTRTFDALINDSGLGASVARWHRDRIEEVMGTRPGRFLHNS